METVRRDRPAGYWRFAETSSTKVADLTGNRNEGLWHGAGATGQHASAVGDASDRAAWFDGTNDFIHAPDAVSLDLSDRFTLEAWVKKNSLASTRAIMAKESANSNAAGTFVFSARSDGTLELLRNGQDSAVSSGTISAGEWRHVAVTFDASADPKVRFYIDGEPAGTSNAIAGSFTQNSQPLLIARRGQASASFGTACWTRLRSIRRRSAPRG